MSAIAWFQQVSIKTEFYGGGSMRGRCGVLPLVLSVLPVFENAAQHTRLKAPITAVPCSGTLRPARVVYSNLEDLGFLPTKAVWLLEPETRNSPGVTCESREFLSWAQDLQSRGFEI
jgi:hypothetical protein